MLTSSVKGEGKSTIAVNLGYTIAQDFGKRTLIIDCDFKDPKVHRYLSVPLEPGISDVLEDRVLLEECLRQHDDLPFEVLSVGGRGSRPTYVPNARRIATILGELRSRFDWILVDVPPVLPLADMNVLAQLADLLILVVRAGSTQQQVVDRAVKTLRAPTQAHLVLNAIEFQSMPYYMSYNYHVPPEARTV